MRNMFDALDVQKIKGRLGQLGPNSVPLWGSMTAPQAVAHCTTSMEWAVLMYKHLDHHLRQFGA